MKKLKSLTIFFPFFNDEGTVADTIRDAYLYGKKVADDLEVITIHGGRSRDATEREIWRQKKKHPDLVVIDRKNNQEGYAVIKYGFAKATKEWVFYTDGDRQYHLDDLEKLVRRQQKTGADVVNGYKQKRLDTRLRVFLGNLYRFFSRVLFALPINDLTCDFRLIRRNFLEKFTLEAKDASVILELVKKLQRYGAKFAQVPVAHYPRRWGKSAYSLSGLLKERVLGDFNIWFRLLADSKQANAKRKIKPS